jgi:PHD/YefM family antitoxin component YafN of YafNO toxin-antitoxin module
MFTQQVVSVTDLRVKTKQSLQGLKTGPKFIFSNNKPIAVMMSVDDYELLLNPELVELPNKYVTAELQEEAKKARKMPKEELLNI